MVKSCFILRRRLRIQARKQRKFRKIYKHPSVDGAVPAATSAVALVAPPVLMQVVVDGGDISAVAVSSAACLAAFSAAHLH